MTKVGIIITTFLRDRSLDKSIKSIQDIWQRGWKIIIVDQNATQEKKQKYKNFVYCSIPYNSGLSYARNYGVKKANSLGCKYCLISADSILFDPSMKSFEQIIQAMTDNKLDLVGLHLQNRIEWEATLELIKNNYFDLDFIQKSGNKTIWPCDIVRNFFIATTKSLLKVMWDNNLKMREHEDFFWRFKQTGYKVGCTKICTGTYNGQKEGQYQKMRDMNMKEGLSYLQKKYKISGWVNYKHIERIRK